MAARPLTEEQRQKIARRQYIGAVPFVDNAYRTDPRTGVANDLIGAGSSSAPLQGGALEGIARALSGGLGGYAAKQQRDKYGVTDNYYANMSNNANRPVVNKALGKGGGGMGPLDIPDYFDPQAAAAPSPVTQVAGAFEPQGAMPPAAPDPTQAPAVGQSAAAPLVPSPIPTATPRVLRPGQTARVGGRPTREPWYGSAKREPWYGGGGSDFSSYKSPAYDPIEAQMEQKYQLPAGTLKGLRMAERSNADQVSPTGARTVYQFVRGTRRRFKEQYGVDAYAGPEQAVEAAALHIRGSLDRGKDIEGALRDYRGVGEDADPGWYARARGGAATGGGASSVNAPNLGIPTSEGINTTQQEPVADMPAPPVRPEKEEFGDRVRSTRLEVARNLLSNSNIEDAAGVFALSQPYLDKGYDEDQAAKVQREKDIRSQSEKYEQAGLDLYNTQAGNRDQQFYSERTAALAGNRAAGVATTDFKRDIAKQNDLQAAALELQAQQDRAALERQNAKPSGLRPPSKQQDGYLGRLSMSRKLTEIMKGVASLPDSINIAYSQIPDSLLQRYDPNGVGVRASIADYTGQLLHELSGAAVTDSEAQRLKPFLPLPSDTPKAIKTKTQRLLVELEAMNADARSLYPSYFDAVDAASTARNEAGWQGASPGKLPSGPPAADISGITVRERK